jgi:hypothetical protein
MGADQEATVENQEATVAVAVAVVVVVVVVVVVAVANRPTPRLVHQLAKTHAEF